MKKLVFETYPVKPGDRIFINDGPWKGDWDIVEVSDRKVKVKCPFKGDEYEWKRRLFVFKGEQDLEDVQLSE